MDFQHYMSQSFLEGEQKKAIETARNALEMKLSPEQAAKISGLPLEQILELQKQTK